MHDDERLAALIDNELDEGDRTALLERLAQDDALRARLSSMKEDRDRLVGSFDALLGQAPLDRLRAALPPAEAEARPSRPHRRTGWPQLAAGVVIGLLLGGAAWLGLRGLGGERESWRTAVTEYMELYTPDTFALEDADSAVQARQLRSVSAKIGVEITPESVAIPGLRYRTALNLSYEGAPLAEIAYTDPTGAPALFCVIADGAPDAPPRTAEEKSVSHVTWSRGGKSYMLVAHMPAREVDDLARNLVARF